MTREVRRKDPVAEPCKITLDQRRALISLCCSKEMGSLKCLVGGPGSGKTILMRVLNEVYRFHVKLLGASIAKQAAMKLEENSGIRSVTIRRLEMDLEKGLTDDLKHHARQLMRAADGRRTWKPRERSKLDENTLLVVDESSMLGSRTLLNVFKKSNGAGILLLGDHKQLPPISDNSCAFAKLSRDLNAPVLAENRRQDQQLDRVVIQHIAEGRPHEALNILRSERGRLVTLPNRQKALEAMTEKWAERGGALSPDEHLLIAPTHVEIDTVNRLAQAQRKKAGLVKEKKIRVGNQNIHLGDRVMFTKNSCLSPLITNGFRGIVTQIRTREQLLTVRLDSGKKVIVPLEIYPHIKLAYCGSVHACQGTGVANTYVALGGSLTSKELSLVQTSRHRKEAFYFTDRFESGSPALENLGRMMGRSVARPMAHEVAMEIKYG